MCTGNCELGPSDQRLKLDFHPADRIPDFFTKNNEGKIVFAEPQPMTTISSPKGHNAWLKIDLVRIDGQFSNAEKYVCLGIKKHSEDEYFDVLHMNNTSRYVDVMDGDPVALVPLLSSTDVASEVTLVVPEEQITPANFGISGGAFDFGSVYRINTEVQEGQWITEQQSAYNVSCIGAGVIDGKETLLAISSDRDVAYSFNGVTWTKLGIKIDESMEYLVYGNGTWCAFNNAGNVRYSTDGGKTWKNSSVPDFPACRCFAFGDGIFITVDLNSAVYTSRDAIIWSKVGEISSNYNRDYIRFLCYGNGKWLAGNNGEGTYESLNGLEWTTVPTNLEKTGWRSGKYMHGYFYRIGLSQYIARSSDGKEWEKIAQPGLGTLVCYKNKLYVFNGNTCHIGFPNP